MDEWYTQDASALWITVKLAGVVTLILLLMGVPLAWWLSRTGSRAKTVIESIVALPLVLPPTVLGFYLLIALGPGGFLGGAVEAAGLEPLAFSFTGLVMGSVIYSLPFVVRPLQSAFESISDDLLEAASTLGASPFDSFLSIAIPLARPGFVTAAILGFAHTVGEFGVVLMIGGNIPGKTRVLSIAIYDHVETLDYSRAHYLSLGLLVFSFLALLLVSIVNKRFASGNI